MRILLTATLLLMLGIAANAQTFSPETDTLIWHVGQLTDLKSDTVQTYVCTFETYPDGTVLWIQNNGAYTTTFNGLSTAGNWSDSEIPGSMEFNVQFMNRTGKFVFERNTSTTTVRMVFMENNENTMPHEFTVTQITPKN